MTIKSIAPAEAQRLMKAGATLIDIREADEFAREHIPGAEHRALSALGNKTEMLRGAPIVFHCKSGGRTAANADKLAACTSCADIFVLEGGIDAWKASGLPVVQDKRQPIEIMRQVQIAAGSLVLAGIVLGALAAPGFYGLAAFVGAGLILAGVTGSCLMAKLLALMPWNRRSAH
jgi:rhodanese-related sulfurtransferase